jgi:hypothetical protein
MYDYAMSAVFVGNKYFLLFLLFKVAQKPRQKMPFKNSISGELFFRARIELCSFPLDPLRNGLEF